MYVCIYISYSNKSDSIKLNSQGNKFVEQYLCEIETRKYLLTKEMFTSVLIIPLKSDPKAGLPVHVNARSDFHMALSVLKALSEHNFFCG